MTTSELTGKIKELRELQALIDEATAEAETIKNEIKQDMGDLEELRAGEYIVSWKSVTGVRFDSTAFKSTHKELFNQYARQYTARRFTVA
jgi:predicted phage-related endonuclease